MDPNKKRFSSEEFEVMLLHKFIIKGAWREYHIYESDVPKGFPSHIRNGIMNAAKDLKRKGLLVAFPHGREHVWILNKNMSDEIIAKVKKYYPEYQ